MRFFVTDYTSDIRWERFVPFWGWLGWIWLGILDFGFNANSIKKIHSDDGFVLPILIFNTLLHLKPRKGPHSSIFTVVRIYWINFKMRNFYGIFANIEPWSIGMIFWLVESKRHLHIEILFDSFVSKENFSKSTFPKYKL